MSGQAFQEADRGAQLVLFSGGEAGLDGGGDQLFAAGSLVEEGGAAGLGRANQEFAAVGGVGLLDHEPGLGHQGDGAGHRLMAYALECGKFGDGAGPVVTDEQAQDGGLVLGQFIAVAQGADEAAEGGAQVGGEFQGVRARVRTGHGGSVSEVYTA